MVEATRSGAWSRTRISGIVQLTIVIFRAVTLKTVLALAASLHAQMEEEDSNPYPWLLFLYAHIPELGVSQDGTMISVRHLRGSDNRSIDRHTDTR